MASSLLYVKLPRTETILTPAECISMQLVQPHEETGYSSSCSKKSALGHGVHNYPKPAFNDPSSPFRETLGAASGYRDDLTDCLSRLIESTGNRRRKKVKETRGCGRADTPNASIAESPFHRPNPQSRW